MRFCDRLRACRAEAEVTLKTVSDALGIPISTYSNYEQGTREPSLKMLALICDYYNVSADYLIGRSEY